MFVSDNNATMLCMVEQLCGKNVQSLLKKKKKQAIVVHVHSFSHINCSTNKEQTSLFTTHHTPSKSMA